MFFITFECLDNYVKTLQISLLKENLIKQRISSNVINLCSSGFPIDDTSKLYNHLINEGSTSLVERFFLQNTFRARQLEQLFGPANSKKYDSSIILCPYSLEGMFSLYHHGYGMANSEMLYNISRFAFSKARIDLSIIIDVTSEQALRNSKLKFSSKATGIAFYNRVRNGYQFIKTTDSRTVVIDGKNDPKDVQYNIWSLVRSRFR